jgi:hypothetical protein
LTVLQEASDQGRCEHLHEADFEPVVDGAMMGVNDFVANDL